MSAAARRGPSGPARHLGRFDVAVVGSGFAGSILARGLAAAGRRVALVERDAHPRFALGESSTPLAAIALERLARRPGLGDLHHLATWGRWTRRRPELRRGLKRGFTFFAHQPGEPWRDDPPGSRRLLVAASPDDAVADVHWLRADVDAALARDAARAGVALLERTALDGAEPGDGGVRLAGADPSGRVLLDAAEVVDATGPGGFLTRALHLEDRSQVLPAPRGLLYAHLEGARDFVAAARRSGASVRPGPYPDERAAVHHLLEEGWLYVLPFDHGVASCGFVLDRGGPADGETPAAAWRRLLGRYPTLDAALGGARFLVGPRWVPRIGHRVGPAAGHRWALLPHALSFVDPMFSTGIAWSLLGVERLLDLLLDGPGDRDLYRRLLEAEADQVADLIGAADGARRDFDRFVPVTLLYFALVSFDEVRQRLLDPPDGLPWAWRPFLAAEEPWRGLVADLRRTVGDGSPDALRRRVLAAVAPRDVAGWDDPARGNLHPVDLAVLVDRAGRLGLTRGEMERALPRLRGGEE